MKTKNKFLILTTIASMSFVSCNKQEKNKVQAPDIINNNNINNSENIDIPKKIKNNQAENNSIELSKGEWIVGDDIDPGRYSISSLSGSGEVYVYYDDKPIILELLTDTGNLEDGVSNVESNLEIGYKIIIPELKSVSFTTVEHSLKTELPAGSHKVNRDIPSGSYTVTCVGTGIISTYTSDGYPIIDETISDEDVDYASSSIDITLDEGEYISIYGIEKTIFTEINN